MNPDARLRLPREPYPGLRPYMDFEAPLLFGRDRQVHEIVNRLAAAQFVAVLGGSGSGKSSLVIAGVVPRLRSHGIPGAGDLWLPMVCTPGTNADSADDDDQDELDTANAAAAPGGPNPHRFTPLARLAQRFATLLKSRGSAAADAARASDIAALLRQKNGLAQMLDLYTPELAVADSLDAADARVMIVLDQFEEVFHTTNRSVPDAGALVQRVMDHCAKPHPRCYVVLTMRSEFLNHCAAYLELPDAINQSAYLVRRLGPDELRAVVTGPAQRFLRLLTRSATPEDSRALPDQVLFEPSVVGRLLQDVSAIADDPDHLPLLQHTLARVWQAALRRVEVGQPVPADITMADLQRAVHAQLGSGAHQALPPELNVLRACIENWPEAIFQHQSAEQQAQLQRLIPRLALKDINTGTYSQQRLNVDEGARLLGPGQTRTDLRTLIGDGFLGDVDYFFWDDENPQLTTLKVSHESLIRGWPRFRNLVDAELAGFDEYSAVLRRCADWLTRRRRDDDLLGPGDLRRLEGSGFLARLQDEDHRQNWARLLRMDRRADQLAPAAMVVHDFVHTSQQRQQERRLRETRAQRSARFLVAAALAFVVLPGALFAWLVQGPTMQRAELLFEAGNRANQALLNPGQQAVGDTADTLQSMLVAGALVDQARTGAGPWRSQVAGRVLHHAGSWPVFNGQRDFLDQVFVQAEPPVNGTLRQLLQGALWRAPPAGSADAAGEVPLPAPDVMTSASCRQERTNILTGRLFVQKRTDRNDTRLLRALFVPESTAGDRSLDVFSASVDPATRECTLGAPVLSSPEVLNSSVVFDAGLRLFFYTADGGGGTSPSMVVQRMDWERGNNGDVQAWQRQTLTSVSDPKALVAVKQAAGNARSAAVPTFRAPGGLVVEVAGRRWFVVDAGAQRVDPGANNTASLTPLWPAAAGSSCEGLARTFAPSPGFSNQVLEEGEHCFFISRGWPPAGLAGPDGATGRPLRDDVRVQVHAKPSADMLRRAQENPPAPLAAIVPFARVDPSPEHAAATSWWLGTSGALSGWLLMKVEAAATNPSGSEKLARYAGAPLTTCALWQMGRQLLRHNQPGAASGMSAATPPAAACQPP